MGRPHARSLARRTPPDLRPAASLSCACVRRRGLRSGSTAAPFSHHWVIPPAARSVDWCDRNSRPEHCPGVDVSRGRPLHGHRNRAGDRIRPRRQRRGAPSPREPGDRRSAPRGSARRRLDSDADARHGRRNLVRSSIRDRRAAATTSRRSHRCVGDRNVHGRAGHLRRRTPTVPAFEARQARRRLDQRRARPPTRRGRVAAVGSALPVVDRRGAEASSHIAGRVAPTTDVRTQCARENPGGRKHDCAAQRSGRTKMVGCS